MKIVRAGALGMCFGVRDALATARRVEDPGGVTIHGELVHNEVVLDELRDRGFTLSGEADRAAIPATPAVLVTAHGVSEREKARLLAAGRQLLDTTCPLVRFVHRSARALEREGRLVLVAGRRGHVEVEGIIGDLERFVVVENPGEVRDYGEPRLGLVMQSTTRPSDAAAIERAIRERNPEADLAVVDTVCAPTKERQSALEWLLAQVEALVVVGGSRSNNTRQLVRSAEAKGIPALHVTSAAELDGGWLSRFSVVGLTAGTSTLDETVDEVEREMRRLGEKRRAA